MISLLTSVLLKIPCRQTQSHSANLLIRTDLTNLSLHVWIGKMNCNCRLWLGYCRFFCLIFWISVFYSLLIFTISWYFNELHRAPFNWLNDQYRQCFSSSCFSQKSISAKIFLSKWRFSLITPILESRDKTRVINFRPISIINKFYIFAKVFEKIISIKLTSIIKNHIPIQQLMFIPDKSTVTKLSIFSSYTMHTYRTVNNTCKCGVHWLQEGIPQGSFRPSFNPIIIHNLHYRLS